MNEEIRQKILRILDQHRVMTIATLRATGDDRGLCERRTDALVYVQPRLSKSRNLSRDDRVSLTIDHEPPQMMDIMGLSMAAHVKVVTEPAEAEKALRLLLM